MIIVASDSEKDDGHSVGRQTRQTERKSSEGEHRTG